MERSETLIKRYEMFIAAAALGAHASKPEGFRQRDVRFLLELFTNWVEHTLPGGMLSIKNTQVLRYMEELVSEGFALKNVKAKQPFYRLTRVGLLEMLNRMSNRRFRLAPEHFFCLYYFLCNYRPRLARLIENEGKHFPLALKIEIETLLDYKRVLAEEIRETAKALKKLTERSYDAERAGRLAQKMFANGSKLEETAAELERRYPYELNSLKPLSELLSELPEDIGRWEVAHGNLSRVEHIWSPAKVLLSGYLSLLKQLAREAG